RGGVVRLDRSLQGWRSVERLDAAVVQELLEFLLALRDAADAVVAHREDLARLREHDFRKAGIAESLVAETPAILVDHDPALLERGPREELAVGIGDRGVALIGAHVGERGIEPPAPEHRLASRAERAEVLRAGDLATVLAHETGVSGEAVAGEDDLLRTDACFAGAGAAHERARQHAARVGNQLLDPVTRRER